MALIEIAMPSMGEGITDATIIRWIKKEGETIEEDEPLVEIATDKVDSEIPSPKTGKLVKIYANNGDVVKVGSMIALISDNMDSVHHEDISDFVAGPVKIESNKAQIEERAGRFNEKLYSSEKNCNDRQINVTPLAKRMIAENGLKYENLHDIHGNKLKGRITTSDIIHLLGKQEKINIDEKKKEEHPEIDLVGKNTVFDTEVIPMGRIRKIIAAHMLMSKRTSPHVTSYIDADVTEMVLWREKIREDFKKLYNERLTVTPLVIEAVIKAIKDFPMINVSVEDEVIYRKKYVNIGVATALPDGNLIVPVIKNACRMNLVGLAREVNNLSGRARSGHIIPDEIRGGTFTVTNLGTFGNLAGTPIINQPEAAILGFGVITKQPAVIETSSGDMIAIRHKMILSLSFDHRVIDGYLGGMFLKRIKEYLESYSSERKI